MSRKSKVTLHPAYQKGEIDRRLFGAFLEPIGNMVIGSMWNPGHPTADDKGFRKDFIEGLKEAKLPSVRMPGGNFISFWRWKDSIGPVEDRKTQLDRPRARIVPKEVGHDEYLTWAERVGFEPMYTINLGSDGINEAVDIVEYTNWEKGTYWADKRIENGHEKPYGVKVWYLGNEMDGPWQTASWEKDPEGYGCLAHEASKVMKWTDPSIETAACVSSCPFLPHYPEWDRIVLERCYETVDYISLHHYHSALPGDIGALMAGVKAYEDYIDTEIALCDYVKKLTRSDKVMKISLDEYGSSFRPAKGNAQWGKAGRINVDTFYQFNPDKKYTEQDPDQWFSMGGGRGRVGEMAMALANATTMMAMIRRADRVKIGCATGGLGMLCATTKEGTYKAAAYYPMEEMIEYAKGVSILPMVETETYDVPSYAIDNQNQYPDINDVPYITAAAALDEENGRFTVFVANADWQEDEEFTLDVSSFGDFKFVEHISMSSDSMEAANTYENPNVILPTVEKDTKCEGGKIEVTLKKLSWNVFRFEK